MVDILGAVADYFDEQLQPTTPAAERIYMPGARTKQLPPDDPRHHLADRNGYRCGCDDADDKWGIWLILTGRGWGKLLCVNTPIPTPSGWVRNGDLRVGDEIFDESGRVCHVTAIHDDMPTTAYRLTFSDGTHIDACGDHQWMTWRHADRRAFSRSPYEDTCRIPDEWPSWRLKKLPGHQLPRNIVNEALAIYSSRSISVRRIASDLGVSRGALTPHLQAGFYLARQPKEDPNGPGPRIRTTQEIVDTLTYGKRGDCNHSIPTCGALDLLDIELPIDPYVLGAWLGDGHSDGGRITIADDDAKDTIDHLRAVGCTVEYVGRNSGSAAGDYKLDGRPPQRDHLGRLTANGSLSSRLRALGLIKNKHVPAPYLRASTEQRLALLQGLMDTDGSNNAGTVEFCSTNKRLADAVVELARSLGQKPVSAESRAMLNGRDCGPRWRITWRPTVPVFQMRRKLAKTAIAQSQAIRNHHRMIVSAEPIPPKPMRCITVDGKHNMYLAGEGMIPTHNSAVGSNWLVHQAVTHPNTEWAVFAPTFRDTRKVCIEGSTGILAAFKPGELKPNGYLRNELKISLTNGSVIYGYTAEQPDRARGANLWGAWADELASWEYEATWHEGLIPALRKGHHPQVVITTTPRPTSLIRDLVKRTDGSVHITRGSTWENRDNLSATALNELEHRYGGTRIGRQELEGELLDETEGALWRLSDIDATRVRHNEVPQLIRIVVAMDPAVSSGEDSDETGIIVAGESKDAHGYILGDYSMRGTPHECMKRVVRAYREHEANMVIGEVNNGGDYIGTLLHTVDPLVPYRTVHASRGKLTRAEPVASLYEQRRMHHVGSFPVLEDQMCTWTVDADFSPDHLDALVWAVSDLRGLFTGAWSKAYGIHHCVCGHIYMSELHEKCPKCGRDTP